MKDIVFKTIMLKGEAGSSVSSIEKISSELNVDTYRITFSDGTSQEFTVTNGTSIESIEKTATSGLQDTYTITLTDGSTYTFQVMNGEDAALYEVPTNSVVGWDSSDPLPDGYEAATDPVTPVATAIVESYLGDFIVSQAETITLSWSNSTELEQADNNKTITPPTGYKYLGIAEFYPDGLIGASLISVNCSYDATNNKLYCNGCIGQDGVTGTATIYVKILFVKEV